MKTHGTWLVLMLVSFGHTLHLTVSQDSINFSAVEDSDELLATNRCDIVRCLNQKGLLLKICLGSICSATSTGDDIFSGCSNRPCESKMEQRKQFRVCLTKECLQPWSNSPLDISQDEYETVLHSTKDAAGDQSKGKTDQLSQERKICINTCFDMAARLGTNVGACVNKLCSLNSAADIRPTLGFSKRWGSRVCLENHCASVESDLDAYVACGIEFCG